MTTITLRVDGMHCASCGLLLDDAVEDLPGVIRVETRVREGRMTVQIDPDRCTPQQIVAVVTETGYAAEVVDP